MLACLKELKLLAVYINDFVLGDEHENFPSWFKMTLDIIETYRISIPFVNKAMDFINLTQIIRSKHAKENMPSVFYG